MSVSVYTEDLCVTVVKSDGRDIEMKSEELHCLAYLHLQADRLMLLLNPGESRACDREGR